jgi:hypothetical protein
MTLWQTHQDSAEIFNSSLTVEYLPANHYQAQASQNMMRGDFSAAFALLKFAVADPGTDCDPLSWIYELEEVGRSYIENSESTDALIPAGTHPLELKCGLANGSATAQEVILCY